MATETGDDSWADDFRVAYRHHLNFYNDGKTAEEVGGDRQTIRALVDRLLATVWDSGE